MTFRYFNRKFPQNFIIRKPLNGAVMIALFCFAIVIAYRPVVIHGTRGFGLAPTMAIYSVIIGLFVYFFVSLLRRFRYFSNHEDWTLFKELLFIFITLSGLGIAIYLAAFAIEPPAPRWNFATFWDSYSNTLLIGLIPFSVFTLINSKYLVIESLLQQHAGPEGSGLVGQGKPGGEDPAETTVDIVSRLKKEHLTFFPSQMLYAEAEGNYTAFYLLTQEKIQKKIIRNTISDIEQQLSGSPFILRVHRAFIVNLNMVAGKKGNVAGYRLKLRGTTTEIPVSRQQTKSFDERFAKIRN